MKEKVTVAIAGISGYGRTYVSSLLNAPDEQNVTFAAAIDPYPERSDLLDQIQAKGIPVFKSLDEFYQQHTVDLMILSTPIQLHAPYSCQAMEKGSYVLCEKPLCATVEEARQMRAGEEKTGKFTAIGYQWSFSDPIQALKRDILNGDFGKPLSMRTLVLWPRHSGYYGRNRWAGRIKSDQGDWVLDSPVNNATAHYLHNMLYLLGDTVENSVEPATLRAELYRANPIENYDTGILRCKTAEGVEIVFVSSHAVPLTVGPLKCYQFERATVSFESTGDACFVARLDNGEIRRYGDPNKSRENKIWQSVAAIRENKPVVCSVKTATPHTLCVNGASKSVEKIVDFPDDLVRKQPVDNGELTYVEGLTDVLVQCYQMGKLPSELGTVSWAVPSADVDLAAMM